MITLQWLEERVKEDDGCWVWQGVITRYGQPQATLFTPQGRKTALVRRVVWELTHERSLATNQWVSCRCKTPGCVHPEHVMRLARGMSARGTKKTEVTKAKIAATKQARSRWPNGEIVKMAQESPLNNVALAAQIGCHHSTIAKIRRGQLRKQYGNPFAGLGAR